jgi:hypothetical protein
LFEACAAAGVRRLVHVSAISAEANVASDYARSKAKADAALSSLNLNWLIVKPSLVIGRGSYGGTSCCADLPAFPACFRCQGRGASAFSRSRPAISPAASHGSRCRDGTAFTEIAGTPVKGFSETLAAQSATLQDRLHARSFFAVPLLHVTVVMFWILTGILTLTPRSFASGTALVAGAAIDETFAATVVGIASVADVILGLLFLLPRWVRRAGVAQLALSAIYLVGLSLLAPEL